MILFVPNVSSDIYLGLIFYGVYAKNLLANYRAVTSVRKKTMCTLTWLIQIQGIY